MADAFDVRGASRQPHQFAGPRQRRFAGIELLPLDLDFRHRRDAANHLDLIAVGLAQPDPLAAAGFIDVFDSRGAGCFGQALEIIFALNVICETDELRIVFLGDMDVVAGISAAHVKRVGGPIAAPQAKTGEKFLHDVEIGRLEAPVCDIHRLHPGHIVLPRQCGWHARTVAAICHDQGDVGNACLRCDSRRRPSRRSGRCRAH